VSVWDERTARAVGVIEGEARERRRIRRLQAPHLRTLRRYWGHDENKCTGISVADNGRPCWFCMSIRAIDAAVKLEDADVATALQDLAIDSAIRAERRRIRRAIAPARKALLWHLRNVRRHASVAAALEIIDAATRAAKKARRP